MIELHQAPNYIMNLSGKEGYMRLPNGYGSVYKLSGKRRNPWCVRKTIGWTFDTYNGKSYPIYQFVGYYPTKAEALTALSDYNKDPYDLHHDTITFAEVFENWSEEHFPKIKQPNVRTYRTLFDTCEPLHKMKIADIKLQHLQMIVDQSGKNTPMLIKMKSMFGQMWDYCVKNEILTKDKREIVRFVDINKGNPNKIERLPFSTQEIEQLWSSADRCQVPLFLIYTGLRISEFYNLKKEDVHLQDRWFQVTKSKTASGIREVPIAEKMVPILEDWMKNETDYVFPIGDGSLQVDKWDKWFRYHHWDPLMDDLHMNHRPHDTRHTCVSLLSSAGVDERIIKKIVGHKGKGVTETVYTHFELSIKLEAINKI